jgi:hypothetical protein
MLVYRSVESVDDAGRMLERVRSAAAAIAQHDARHEPCVDALLSSAELETAVLDARFDGADDVDPVERACRRATERSGATLVASWLGDQPSRRAHAVAFSNAARELRQIDRLGSMRCRAPEGFAYYAVYPELYADAAVRFARARRPEHVTVIGIRTIGTALSAAVAAALRARGVGAESCTVRPRGHPFDRELALTPRMRAWLCDRARGWFAVVDEGPGISGSSFAAVARLLATLGVADERIVLFPSWLPEASSLCNADARRRWEAHDKFVESFEHAFVRPGRLANAWDATLDGDWSGGRWRDALYAAGECPSTQPQHEQRKFVCRRQDGARLLLKFVGLGRHGRARREIAETLADASLGPTVHGLRHGFLAVDLVDGRPSSAPPTRADLAAIASYVARRAGAVPSTVRCADLHELLTATRVNVAESLDEACAGRACELVRSLGRAPARVAVDGRMQPQEWIRSGATLTKTDGIAHHDDHFLQPPADPVWDIAGASVEWQLDGAQEEYLVREYASRSGDFAAGGRVAPCRVAYLAQRVGYASLAADTLGASPDGRGMRALAARYRAQLRSSLAVE